MLQYLDNLHDNIYDIKVYIHFPTYIFENFDIGKKFNINVILRKIHEDIKL